MLPAGIGAEYKEQENYFASQEYKDRAKKGLSARKRNLPHPKELSYPVAVSPEENSGSRLLIKCFEYIPPKNTLGYEGKGKINTKTFTDPNGVKQVKNDYLREKAEKGKKGKIQLFPTKVGMKSFGASAPADQLYKNFGIDKENIINKIKEKL